MEAAIKDVLARLQPVTTVEFDDPITGGKGKAILAPQGWNIAKTITPQDLRFPTVAALSAEAFIAYAKQFGGESSLAFWNVNGFRAELHYDDDSGKPVRRDHRLVLSAAWAPECAKQVAAIREKLGQAMKLEQFEALAQRAALVIENSAGLLESINDLEGVEVVKVSRTRTGQAVSVSGNVKGGIDIPRAITVRGRFMGEAVMVVVPFRVTVNAGQIAFELIDDGAFDIATNTAALAVAGRIREAIAPIPLYEGTITE